MTVPGVVDEGLAGKAVALSTSVFERDVAQPAQQHCTQRAFPYEAIASWRTRLNFTLTPGIPDKATAFWRIRLHWATTASSASAT